VSLGDVVTVSYVGTLFSNRKEFDKGPSLTFKIGGGSVMPGFEKGMMGIKEGGKRIIRIPPQLAYGETGVRAKIPPNSDLEMEVEVAKIAR
jgi:FKBP-type peptidyl-prolyl cis-trans isomerase